MAEPIINNPKALKMVLNMTALNPAKKKKGITGTDPAYGDRYQQLAGRCHGKK